MLDSCNGRGGGGGGGGTGTPPDNAIEGCIKEAAGSLAGCPEADGGASGSDEDDDRLERGIAQVGKVQIAEIHSKIEGNDASISCAENETKKGVRNTGEDALGRPLKFGDTSVPKFQ